jgi:hypothetical protein
MSYLYLRFNENKYIYLVQNSICIRSNHKSLLKSLLNSSIHVREILLKVALNTKTVTLYMYVELHLRQTRITIHFLS